MGIRDRGHYFLCVKDWPDGRRFKRKYPNEKQARNMLTRIEASILDGSWRELRETLKVRGIREDGVLLRDYADTYLEDYAKARNKLKSWQRKQVCLKALNRHLGHIALDALTPAHLHNYVKKRKAEGVSEATINRDLTTIKHLLTYAVDCGVIEVNQVERFRLLREERKERPRFTDKQIQAVISALRPDCRPLFVFIRETGCRREEALSLQHWQVQKDQRMVVFSHGTKSKKYRYVPLTQAALEALEALPRLPDCPYVFYRLQSRDRWWDCRKVWEKARRAVGHPDLCIKDLRRHYAIKLAEDGADMHDIQQVLGHASVATTEKHYAQFSPRHSARKILRVLEGGKSKEPTRNFARDEEKARRQGLATNG
jgi:site-specific recombinase XerD